MTDPNNPEEVRQFLRNWAADNKAVFDWEGECGFGRECVGISRGGHWVYLTVCGGEEYRIIEGGPPWDLVCAPPETPDAYHKTDCMAVLGRGEERIQQLFFWVKKLADNNVGIEMIERPPMNSIDAMLNGLVVPRLCLLEVKP